MQPALAVHGGAWNIPDDSVQAHAAGVAKALEHGWSALLRGAAALDAVESVVRMLEDDPTFNAGHGAHLNREGRVELDASIMEGSKLRAGAVAAIEGVRHPVTVARRVMEKSPHVLLVGGGARRFAKENDCETCRTSDLLVGRELDRYRRIRKGERRLVDLEFRSKEPPHGTVGAVALDRKGHLAAATSTGGTQDKAPGRVGDTPIIGAGTYADDRAGAASSTGWGEGILRVVLAKAAVDRMRSGASPAVAGRAAIAALARIGFWGGVILLDRKGNAAAVFNSPRMARGVATAREIRVEVGKAGRR